MLSAQVHIFVEMISKMTRKMAPRIHWCDVR